MLKPHLALEDIEHGLDDEALTQQELVGQRHQMVAHVASDAGDEMPAALPELGEQRVADIALVGVDLACEVLGDLRAIAFLLRHFPQLSSVGILTAISQAISEV